MLKIEELDVSIGEKQIIQNLSLTLEPGHVYALMGRNGAGKSTLAKTLAGHPSCEVTNGSVTWKGTNLVDLEPSERAIAGLFLSFQYPPDLEGLPAREFLYAAYQAQQQARDLPKLDPNAFEKRLHSLAKTMGVPEDFLERGVNEGFSGGEKKRNEMLQMHLLNPECVVLDETDSGLDIDALKAIAAGVNAFIQPDKVILLITHYQRLLDYIPPHKVFIMANGRIVKEGPAQLARDLEQIGYEGLE